MIYISYFYNIRFFPENLIPMSTAMWDPKWYHNNGPETIIFKDKRNVINGARAQVLAPTEENIHISLTDSEMCKGPEICRYSPINCKFLKRYYDYLSSLDFYSVISSLEADANKLRQNSNICLMVYETPSNPCSERQMLIKWFNNHGVDLPEWNKDMVK